MLGCIPFNSPVRVIQILSPTSVIDACGLNVSKRVRADPNFSPRGRYHQGFDAVTICAVGDDGARNIDIGKPVTPSPPADPGGIRVTAAETGHGDQARFCSLE
jgi:hypothetical protein